MPAASARIGLIAALAAAAYLRDGSWASADQERWRRELGRVAETYEKWGITFETNASKLVPGEAGPFPSYFDAKVALEGEDTVRFTGEVGLGERSVATIGIKGSFKVSPHDKELTGTGALSIKGTGGNLSYRYSSKDGLQLGMGIDETFYSVGIEIGRGEGSPIVLGLKGGPFKVKIDPVKWKDRLVEMGPEMAEKVFHTDPDLLARAEGGGSLVDEGDADVRVGGVLLTTRVRFEDGLQPVGIHLRDGAVAFRTRGGSIPIQGLTPSIFAGVARGMLLRNGPVGLSIGTQSSKRPGHMRVSYLGPIRNTDVGRVLLVADQRLKGLMYGFGLGTGGARSGTAQKLLWGFPDASVAHAMRLWIVGGEVTLGVSGNRIVRRTSGIRLRYEMHFRGHKVSDPDLDTFVEEFSRRWPEVAADVPELRALEEPILAAALARWIEEDPSVELDSELLAYPSEQAATPAYVPAAAIAAGGQVVTGGIGLDGDLPVVTPGTAIAFALANGARPWMLWVAALLSLLPALLLAPVLKPESEPISWRVAARALGYWGAIVAAVVAAAVVTVELAFPMLGDFDDEFLSLAVLLLVPAGLLQRYVPRRQRSPNRRFVVDVYGLTALCVLAALVASIGTERLLLASSKRRLTPATLAGARVMAAPVELVMRPLVSIIDLVPWPQPLSLARSTVDRFELDSAGGPSPASISVRSTGLTGPIGTVVDYEMVRSPGLETREGKPIYTPDGRPLY